MGVSGRGSVRFGVIVDKAVKSGPTLFTLVLGKEIRTAMTSWSI
jgi:hypothetical protein